jgi:hypothetical protein
MAIPLEFILETNRISSGPDDWWIPEKEAVPCSSFLAYIMAIDAYTERVI